MNESEVAAGLAPTPNYRYADVVGDRLFLAGQVPLDGAGTLIVPGDVTAQTHQCLTNLFDLLAVHGFTPADIHRLTIYVVGPQEHLGVAWRAMTDRFDDDVPPATLLGVHLLGYVDQLVEIDAHVERG